MAGFHNLFITIPDPCADDATRAGQADFIGNNQIHRVAAFNNMNVWMIQRFADQGVFNLFSGGIGGMQNAAVAVPPSRVR
jgi:hypothetical protein